MTVNWVWDKHHEEWAPSGADDGATTVYQKPFTAGVSVQRVIVRFTPWSSGGIDQSALFRLPADQMIDVKLAIGQIDGAINLLAYEEIAPLWDYRRLSDTDPTKFQVYWGRWPSVFWDIDVRYKNIGQAGQQATVILTVVWHTYGLQFPGGIFSVPTFAGLQFDALYSRP